MTTASISFPVDHPCAAGHFPGNPIIPGALLLDEVLAVIGAQTGCGHGIWQVKSAKFPQSVRPGDTVHIDYTRTASGEIRFECNVAGHKVMSGMASCRPPVGSREP